MEPGKVDGEKARQALTSAWKSPRCPFSGHNEWTLIDDFVELRPYFSGSLAVGGPVYPAVMAICNGCGFMALFSAVKLGLLGSAEKDNEHAS